MDELDKCRQELQQETQKSIDLSKKYRQLEQEKREYIENYRNTSEDLRRTQDEVAKLKLKKSEPTSFFYRKPKFERRN